MDMKLRIKIPKGNYALRTFDKNGNQIYYTSSRLNGFTIDKDELQCEVPDESKTYELKDLSTLKVAASGEINVHDKPKDLQTKR
jgi:hypothetical protein